MSYVIPVFDSQLISYRLRQNTPRHIYEIGDLDMPYARHTRWYGWQTDEGITLLALLYTAYDPPILIALPDDEYAHQYEAFLMALMKQMPPRVYAHLAPGMTRRLQQTHQVQHHGLHQKYLLTDRSRIDLFADPAVRVLTRADLPAIQALYAVAYQENVFTESTLDTQRVVGLYLKDKLITIAGIHVYSRVQGVCALGNVTTHPDYRGHGHSLQTCARLLQLLEADGIPDIGLNVRSDNVPAIAVYRKLGFTFVMDYDELTLERR